MFKDLSYKIVRSSKDYRYIYLDICIITWVLKKWLKFITGLDTYRNPLIIVKVLRIHTIFVFEQKCLYPSIYLAPSCYFWKSETNSIAYFWPSKVETFAKTKHFWNNSKKILALSIVCNTNCNASLHPIIAWHFRITLS